MNDNLVKNVQFFLNRIANAIGKYNKIIHVNELFDYLTIDDNIKIIHQDKYINFLNVVKNKMIQFYYIEELHNMSEYYSKICNKNIPTPGEKEFNNVELNK